MTDSTLWRIQPPQLKEFCLIASGPGNFAAAMLCGAYVP